MKYLSLLILLSALPSTAQDMEKDTIRLKEVVISTKQNPKTKKFKYRSGGCRLIEHLAYNTEAVTLIEKVPDGYLRSVTFFVNEATSYVSDKLIVNYQDTQLELLLYEANADNTPGSRIEPEKIIIVAKKDHRGKLEVDLAGLNIRTDKKFFIGLRRITQDKIVNHREFEIDCICNRDKKYTSYTRRNDSYPWGSGAWLSALKMDIKIELL